MRLPNAALLSLLSLLSLVACAKPAPPGPQATPSATTNAATAGAAPATASALTTAANAPDGGKAALPDSLLDLVQGKIAVSSSVFNPKDFPEHLIDGRADTAWNSKTGDLGGWIAFRVPTDAKVDHIEMNVGFDKIARDGTDLFTANHRIKRVALEREAGGGKFVLVREVTLDPNVRGLQNIAVSSPGGAFRVRVLETVPGTKKAWKELTVSEFRVVGDPATAVRAREPLRVGVGSLDAKIEEMKFEDVEESQLGQEAFPSIDALCNKFIAKEKAALAEFIAGGPAVNSRQLVPGSVSCHEIPSPVAFAAKGPYRGIRAVHRSDGFASGSELVLESARGMQLLPITWAVDDVGDPGCGCIVRNQLVEEVRVEGDHLVFVVDADRIGGVRDTKTKLGPNDDGTRVILLRNVYWGRFASENVFALRQYNVMYQTPLATKTQPHGFNAPRTPWATIPWEDVRPFSIGTDGVLHVQN